MSSSHNDLHPGQPGQAEFATSASLRKDGERRQVTILFADIVGFTAFTAGAGEEHAFALMQRVSKLLNVTVQEQGCIIKHFTGDGIMAFFGVPTALEDAPLRACRAALLIDRRLAAVSDEIEGRHGVRPQLRMCINSGLVVFGQVTEGEVASVTAHGDSVNLGSRMLSSAEPGAILIGEETQRFVLGSVESRFAGTFKYKGAATPQRVYRLLGLCEDTTRFAAARRRGLTEFVGRDSELHTMDVKLRQLDSMCIIDISGEAGIGKSRLLHEFRCRLRGERIIALTGGCSSGGEQAPLRPAIDVVRRAFRLGSYEPHATTSAKIQEGLSRRGLGSPQNCDLLLHLLGLPTLGALHGLDGTLIGTLLRELLLQLLKELCCLSKVVLLLEDLHWIDVASEDLLMSIIGRNDHFPLLIVHTRRPEYRPPWYDWSGVIPMVLAPLSKKETLQIVSTRLAVNEVPESLGDLIVEKAEGNALFAEEITSFLVEHGSVRLTPTGLSYHEPAVAAALPGSLQLLLTTRVDRLPVGDRSLLQVGAVIGRRFDLRLLAAVVNSTEGDVARSLSRMQDADLVYHDKSCDDYVFKHALVREALNSSLLSTARAQLHLKVAQEIEKCSADGLTEVAEILAYHYSVADQPDPAFRYLCLAGRKCLDIYSLEGAAQYFRQALSVYDTKYPRDNNCGMAKAVVGLLEALYLSGNVLETKRVAEFYIPRLEDEGPSPELVFSLYFLSLMLANLCMFQEGEAKARQALAIAEKTGDVKATAYARSCLFFLTTVLGRASLEAMETMGAKFVAECEKASDNYILNWAYWSIAWDYMHRGLMGKARHWIAKLIEAGRDRNDRRALGLAHWALAWIEIFASDYDEAARNAEEALKAAVAPYDQNAASQVKAAVMIFQGRLEEGRERLLVTRQWAVDNGWLYPANGTGMSMALALALSGDLQSAVTLLRTSIKAADANGSRGIAAWYRIVLAELYLGVVSSTSRAPLRVIMRNFGTILGIALFGARWARALLVEARQNEQFAEFGTACARIERDLGMLARHEKRLGDARNHFACARKAAEAQSATMIIAEIDAAIAALGKNE
jgi:class 3 adenylate cyclase/tetratricopeptide (TPR) repeat protein